jgi:hypothetical protein
MYGFTVKRVSRKNPRKLLARHSFFGKTPQAAVGRAKKFFGLKGNVEQGFWDSTGFHPIRASSDYSAARAGEKRARSRRAIATRVRAHHKRARR